MTRNDIRKLIADVTPLLTGAGQSLATTGKRLAAIAALLDASIKARSTERVRLALKALSALEEEIAATVRFSVRSELRQLQTLEPGDGLLDELAAVDGITRTAGLLKTGLEDRAAAIKRLQDKANHALEVLSKDIAKVSGHWAERFAEALANRVDRAKKLATIEKRLNDVLEQAKDATRRRDFKALDAAQRASAGLRRDRVATFSEQAALDDWLADYDPEAVDSRVRRQLERDALQLAQLVRRIEILQDRVADLDDLVQGLNIAELDIGKTLRALGWPDLFEAKARAAAKLEFSLMLSALSDVSRSTDKALSADSIRNVLSKNGVL